MFILCNLMSSPFKTWKMRYWSNEVTEASIPQGQRETAPGSLTPSPISLSRLAPPKLPRQNITTPDLFAKAIPDRATATRSSRWSSILSLVWLLSFSPSCPKLTRCRSAVLDGRPDVVRLPDGPDTMAHHHCKTPRHFDQYLGHQLMLRLPRPKRLTMPTAPWVPATTPPRRTRARRLSPSWPSSSTRCNTTGP